jgi:putative flippase GtrA
VTVERVVARQGLVDGGARFLATGLVVLPLSLGLYLGSVRVGVDPHVARVLSYVVGTALVAVLHRRWTFRTPGVRGALAWTALLYATTFAVVLITHGLALAVLPMVVAAPWITAGAWCVSQGLGTTINFLILRGAVFR